VVVAAALWRVRFVFLGVEEPVMKRREGVTLVTHLIPSEIRWLKNVLSVWQGPVAVSFFVTQVATDLPLLKEFEDFAAVHPSPVSFCWFASAEYIYPVNIMRNRALQLAATELVLILDVNILPDPGLYRFILSHYSSLHRLSSYTVFVLPLFEFGLSLAADAAVSGAPQDKKALLRMIRSGSAQPMYAGVDDIPYITATKLDDWYESEELYSISYQELYEPFILGSSVHLPMFDERFLHSGYDRIQFVHHIYYRGFSFQVLPDHFLVFFPVGESVMDRQNTEDAFLSERLFEFFKQNLHEGSIV